MKMKDTLCTLWLVLCTVILTACSQQVSPPGPNTLTGSLATAGYVMHRWDLGITMLLFFDKYEGVFCESSSGSGDLESLTECSINPASGGEIIWQVRSSDGKDADLTIDDEHFDVSADALFFIQIDGPDVRVEKLDRELGAIPFEQQAVLQLVEADDEIQSYIISLE